MSNYNYIRHLNAFFSFVRSDNRLSCSHVSLYLALFQYWNFNRFNNPFPVYRENLMQISKIGSKNTYHKCIRLLHETEYIIYHPPLSKFQPVKISIRKLDAQHQERSFKQLELFNSSTNKAQKPSTNSDTVHVPKLSDTSTRIDTGTVPKVGQYIKQNNKTENSVYNTPTKIFDKNRKIAEAVNEMGRVSKSEHDAVTL